MPNSYIFQAYPIIKLCAGKIKKNIAYDNDVLLYFDKWSFRLILTFFVYFTFSLFL